MNQTIRDKVQKNMVRELEIGEDLLAEYMSVVNENITPENTEQLQAYAAYNIGLMATITRQVERMAVGGSTVAKACIYGMCNVENGYTLLNEYNKGMEKAIMEIEAAINKIDDKVKQDLDKILMELAG